MVRFRRWRTRPRCSMCCTLRSATRWSIDVGAAAPLTLRFVGALRDSVLQGELIIGEEQFVRLFPDSGGFRFFLIDSDRR